MLTPADLNCQAFSLCLGGVNEFCAEMRAEKADILPANKVRLVPTQYSAAKLKNGTTGVNEQIAADELTAACFDLLSEIT